MAANGIFLAGNLVRDPELQDVETSKGSRKVLSFRIAVDEAGNKQDESGFFNCQAWGTLAEGLAETVHKGDRVVVAGTLRHRSFKGDDGKSRSTIEVSVTDAGPSMLWATAAVTRPERKAAPAAEPVPEPVRT